MKKLLFFLTLFLITNISAYTDCPNCNYVGPSLAGMRCIQDSECRSGLCFYDESESRTGICNPE